MTHAKRFRLGWLRAAEQAAEAEQQRQAQRAAARAAELAAERARKQHRPNVIVQARSKFTSYKRATAASAPPSASGIAAC